MSLTNFTPKLGRLILSVGATFFAWFTVWMLVSPFYDDECMFSSRVDKFLAGFQAVFPNREWGVKVPVTIGVITMTAMVIFFGVILRRTK